MRRHDDITSDMLTKYASLESAKVLELKSSPTRSKQASLDKLADFHDYRTEDGYLYARIRAISSRVNKNHDGWPTIELAGGPEEWEKESSRHEAAEGGFTVQASKGKKYGFSTFLGKPHFVDHHNSDPKRARGVVVDASFHVLDQKTAAADDEYWGSDSVDPEHNPPCEVELLIEVDAESFPKLAKAIVNGDIDGFSMGCDVDYSKCSHCDHKASSPDEYCSHVQAKGAEFDFTSKDGKTSSRKSYENCYGIKFFEISAVFDPADETALAKEIHAEGKESKTAAEGQAVDLNEVQRQHDFLRNEYKWPKDRANEYLLNKHNNDPAVQQHLYGPDAPAGPIPNTVEQAFDKSDYVPTPEEYENLRSQEQKVPATYEGIERTEKANQQAVTKPVGNQEYYTPTYQVKDRPIYQEDVVKGLDPAKYDLAQHPDARGRVQPNFIPGGGNVPKSRAYGSNDLGNPNPYVNPAEIPVEGIETLAKHLVSMDPSLSLEEAMQQAQAEISQRFKVDPDQVGGDGAYSQEPKQIEYDTRPNPVPVGAMDVTPRHQGSYLGARIAATKLAQPEEPQADHVHAPEEVSTMREEKVCPLCGSDMEDGKCDVCGYDEPPESMQNPDLGKAREQVEELEAGETAEPSPDLPEGPPGPNIQPQPEEETYLNARNTKPASTVNSEMRWAPRIDLPKISASGPKGDEPDETVISDQTTPVTSALRTAKELIQAAKRNQKGNTMSDDVKKVAADPADPSAAAKKQVDATGVGGVDDASAEAASKADTQTDVTGKGGIIQDSNAEASKPSDGTESLPSETENAGFQPGGETGPETQTFDNSNEPESAVTDKAFPTAANHGTQPADPIGKAQDRIDVETPPHDQVGDKTNTWSGTSGNGVTKQQEAVTSVPTQSGGVKASGTISLAALKLADAEVELGLTQKDDKYNRLAELAEMPEDEIAAEHRALAKVKTAGLTRTASKGASRLPSFQRIASEETPAPQPVDDALLDSALYN
jgi:hypothetical protein